MTEYILKESNLLKGEQMISKELLSEVLEFNVDNITTIDSVNIKQLLIIGDKCIDINIYELAFLTMKYLKTKSKYLNLNQSIDSIFKEANDIYESLSK